ncbi:acetyl-CoA carboxylase carboxyltransferase subunit alpha [Hathewaya limosa]|uniref:Multifunctional fusion protein n=1 Tax=Hathewaya limosa TaxID=1536 RepID=A0ABU0JXA6_HATLI|nr:acetyl-CoA carboxylase carboxyltransferase subunit alpha [Hathewaya limosa]MDQ0480744.1 acetyl-CoA carboxylase carboxyl transferase subunit beta [Hathewaya limosa]
MGIKNIFRKNKYATVNIQNTINTSVDNIHEDIVKPNIPNGMWIKCNCCKKIVYKKDIENSLMTCSECGTCFRLAAKERIKYTIDSGTFKEMDKDMKSENPLNFPGYNKKIEVLMENKNLNEAVITGVGKINGINVAIGVMDSQFMMGSMGSVVGEKITRLFELAKKKRLPVILFTASGGARMQEGMFSLMQMAKVSAAIKKHSEKGLLYITVLTDPTTGGVTASFAMQGDIILSEPKALIGFAGKRVIEQTIKQKLPEEFQSAEFLLDKGFVDKIVKRKDMKETLAKILSVHCNISNDVREEKNGEDKEVSHLENKNIIKTKKFKLKDNDELGTWEKVKIARLLERPTALDYINKIFDYFEEFHGDRLYGDDSSIISGIGSFKSKPVTVIGIQKGRDLQENIKRNFGMPHPEGYRKALRLMKQAEKFKRPVICFIDTPGAFCGIEAEERGQGEAIAKNLMEMSDLKSPIISIIIGEGGSGGALALAVADEVWMLENSIYSILSPEGFASILFKDAKKCIEVSDVMKITSKDLMNFGIIDRVIKEPYGGAHKDIDFMCKNLEKNLEETLIRLCSEPIEGTLKKRYYKFRKIGKFIE